MAGVRMSHALQDVGAVDGAVIFFSRWINVEQDDVIGFVERGGEFGQQQFGA
jgi:hypothetical protein